MHVLEAFGPRLVGLQARDDTTTGAVKLTVALAELPLYDAVTVAVELLATAAVVTLKVAEVADAATVTDAGVVRTELLSERVTLAPPDGAAWVKVTVHVLEELGPRLAGLHASEETVVCGARLTVALDDVPL